MILLGLAIGLLAMTPGITLYYWLFAPAVPLVLAVFALVLSAKFRHWKSFAEGLFAASVFGLVFVVVGSSLLARGLHNLAG